MYNILYNIIHYNIKYMFMNIINIYNIYKCAM